MKPGPGTVIAVTGASSGIGAAIALASGRAGCSVALGARRMDRLQSVADAIETAGGRALTVPGDLISREAADQLIQRTVATFGRLDVMVANAGIGYHGHFETTPDEAIERLLAVNLGGTFYAVRAALGVMRQQQRGHIIVISSIVGRRGIGGSAVYSATKAAQVALVESLRAECLDTDIHISVVLPVSTVTEFHDAIARDFGYRVSGSGPRQTADHVAAAVMRCIQSPKPEVYPYAPSRLLAIANVIAPGLTDRLVKRFRRQQADPGHDGHRS